MNEINNPTTFNQMSSIVQKPMPVVNLRALPAKVKELDCHLRRTYPDSVVVPLKIKNGKKKKRPVMEHVGLNVGRIRNTHHPPSPEHNNWGILLGTDLCVIDFDNEEKHTEWLDKFPEDFATGPWETTKHGHHYYFENDMEYTCETGIEPKVDLLAIESTGTRRVCQCAPTPDKEWMRNLIDTKAQPMSLELKAYLKDLMKKKESAPVKLSTPEEHGEHVEEHATLSVDSIRTILSGLDRKACEPKDAWLEVCFLTKNTVEEAESDECLDVLVEFCSGMKKFSQKEITKLWYKTDTGTHRKGIPSWKKLIIACGNKQHLALLKPGGKVGQMVLLDDEHSVVEEIRARLKGRLFESNGETWLQPEPDSLWVCGTTVPKRVRNFIGQQEIWLPKGKKEVMVSKQMTFKSQCATQVLDCIEGNQGFEEIVQNNLVGKLPFTDGVFDFSTKSFTTGFGSAHCYKTCPRAFPATRNPAVEKELMSRFFMESHDGQTDEIAYLLHVVAKAMAGESTKAWYHLFGERNCGKSLFFLCLVNVFGTSFVKVLNSGCLLKQKHNSGDQAKMNSYLVEHEWARISYFVEMDMGETTSSKAIKAFTGGDVREGRKNFQDEKSFKVKSTLIGLSNGLPPADNTDCFETMQQINYPTKFVPAAELATAKSSYVLKAQCPFIKDWMATPEVSNALFWLLVDAYHTPVPVPQSVRDTKLDYVSTGSPMLEALGQCIEYSGKSTDTITTKHLLQVLKERGVPNMQDSFKGHLQKDVLNILGDPGAARKGGSIKSPMTWDRSNGKLRYIKVKPREYFVGPDDVGVGNIGDDEF